MQFDWQKGIRYGAEGDGAGGESESAVVGEETTSGGETTAGETTETEIGATGEDKTEVEIKPAAKPWQTARIDELTRHWRNAERERDELALENAQLKAGKAPAAGAAAATTEAPAGDMVPASEVARRAAELAAQTTATNAYNAMCNEIVVQGNKDFKDFPDAIKAFAPLGGLPQPLIEIAAETGVAHKIIHALGNDLDEAARIFALSPTKMTVELVRLGQKLSSAKPLSKAPLQGTDLRGTARGEKTLDSPDITTEEWVALREKQIANRNKAA